RFHAAIRVTPEGVLDITESITARFTGSWNGIYRSIPIKYRTPQGFNWSVDLDLVSATGEDGAALRTETSRERHYLKYKIWVPGAVDASRTVVLRYRVTNGLRFFEEHDELYWNITGDEWEVPIEAASATIALPAAAEGVRATAFNGPYGSTARDATIEIEGSTVRVAMPHRLEFREGLTAVVGWNKGLVAEPTATDRAAGFLANNWPLAIPIPVFFLAFARWKRRGRDPERRPIVVQYEPPPGLTPAELGTLIDHSADMRDVTATMVDLAVRGFLRIEERDDRKLFGLISDREYVLHRLKPPAEWNGLAPHEQRVLEGIFEGQKASRKLSDMEDEFYSCLPGIRDGVFDRLTERGYYHARPDKVRARWIVLAIAFGLAVAAAGSMFGGRFSLSPVPFIAAAVLSAGIILCFGLVMPARSESGARALEKARGFEEFLTRVEDERYKRMITSPELFDRYLPFAMAFGVEKKWARAFEDIYREPPTWYAGTGPATSFNVSHFSSRLADFSGKAGSTMSSSPRSSGGSGFSGGSSGGGGGGGGGGGF
ncbi:MAG TPA: DUF2207 domain-containing protein, partial [Gemmatimonadales bacterium]|nr:DUF2207 domain-containing protein [Gemmatimonadales bacterium]